MEVLGFLPISLFLSYKGHWAKGRRKKRRRKKKAEDKEATVKEFERRDERREKKKEKKGGNVLRLIPTYPPLKRQHCR